MFFFFNDTATTEIYTRSIVGSVRCVQETGYQRRVHGCDDCQSTHLEKKCTLISKKKLKERVSDTAVKVENQLENQAKEINNIMEKCIKIREKEKNNEISQTHLYEFIETIIKELICKKQDAFRSEDEGLKIMVTKLHENLELILKNHEQAIEKIKDISSQLGQDKIPKINELAEKYKPVSYTHLRAHETSLHLVCRLLLEKKKNHITTLQLNCKN
eukprot:TRINITY_DN6471_c0_g1_i2.p1 TRINITY_DN6471_c0_g1~~TRINITY_DN6471_c0_g1_i2.p1  ORF type:complete len:216 (+),score=78.15 TRINITY_DN6471_c0_g1_i2:77-724(+)